MATTSPLGGQSARFRLTAEDEKIADEARGLLHEVRGELPRNLWLRYAALQHARRIQQGEAPALQADDEDVAPTRASSGKGEARVLFTRFRLTPEEITLINRARKKIPMNLWLRAAALRYTRWMLEEQRRGKAVGRE